MQAKLVTIDSNKEGQRLDNFLIAYFKNVPKSRIYRAIRSGEVRVNKKRAKQTYRLQLRDSIRIPPIQNYSAESRASQQVPEELMATLENSIIYEDEYLMVLNKPSGIAAHSGTGERWGVIEIMRASREHQPFLELAHRIDKETSGCLVLAKTRRALLDAQQSLQDETSMKEYTLLVKGQWQVKNKRIEHALDKHIDHTVGAKMMVDEQGKQAVSIFSTIELFSHNSLIKAAIETGRTHQIRVHAQQEGYPLVGDKRYGDFAHNREIAKLGFKRMFLHATQLKLKLRDLSQNYEFTAPMPSELKTLCRQLRKQQ